MQHDAYRVADFAGFSWLSVSMLVYAMFSWLYSEHFCKIKITMVSSSFFGNFGVVLPQVGMGVLRKSLANGVTSLVQMMEPWFSVS